MWGSVRLVKEGDIDVLLFIKYCVFLFLFHINIYIYIVCTLLYIVNMEMPSVTGFPPVPLRAMPMNLTVRLCCGRLIDGGS